MTKQILSFDYPEARSLVVCGDIHGAFEEVVFKLCVQYSMTDTLLIVAGDCGFGFEKPGYYEQIFYKISGRLTKANNWVVMIRGNHDDPPISRSSVSITSGSVAFLTIASLLRAGIPSSASAEPSA